MAAISLQTPFQPQIEEHPINTGWKYRLEIIPEREKNPKIIPEIKRERSQTGQGMHMTRIPEITRENGSDCRSFFRRYRFLSPILNPFREREYCPHHSLIPDNPHRTVILIYVNHPMRGARKNSEKTDIV